MPEGEVSTVMGYSSAAVRLARCGRAPGRRVALVSMLLALAGPDTSCAVEGEPRGGQDSHPPALLATQPAAEAWDVSRRVEIELVFDEYLAPVPLRQAGLLQLSSGSRRVSLSVKYDPVGKRLRVSPRTTLLPQLVYRLETLHPERIQDLYGNPVAAPGPELTFLTAADLAEEEVAPPAAPGSLRGPVEEVFARRCLACHGEGRATGLLDLRRRAPLTARVARTRGDRVLVVPGHPAESYLLHKLLPGYPDLGGEPMPRGGPPLDTTELSALARLLARSSYPD